MGKTFVVKRAEPREIFLCEEIGRRFSEEAKRPWHFHALSFQEFWRGALSYAGGPASRGVIFLALDKDSVELGDPTVLGAIGGFLAPDVNNNYVSLATEMFWYVYPECRGPKAGIGKALLEAFEGWAKSEGAHYISVSSIEMPGSVTVEAFYRRKGYCLLEKVWTRKVDRSSKEGEG